MVGWFVENEKVSVFTFKHSKGKLRAFTARQHSHLFIHIFGDQACLRKQTADACLIPSNVSAPKLAQHAFVWVKVSVFLIVTGNLDEPTKTDRGVFAFYNFFDESGLARAVVADDRAFSPRVSVKSAPFNNTLSPAVSLSEETSSTFS